MDKIPPEPPDPPPIHNDNDMEIITPLSRKRQILPDLADPSPKKSSASPSASVQTIYIHPSLSEKRKYSEEYDKSPFLVHVSRKISDPSSGTSIQSIKFGQFLVKNNIKNITKHGIKNVGRNKISVEFLTANDANNFLNDSTLENNNYDATIPSYNVTRMGLVRQIPTEWSMEEFVNWSELSQGTGQIVKARRLNRKTTVDGKQ